MDTQELRADLDQIVREADAIAAAHAAEPEEDDEDAGGSEIEREEAMVEVAMERRAEAVAAIARLEDGTFGACIDCGEQINPERLAFRPEAARCLSCQEKFEQR
jgi:DnaK suppressor protein